MSIHEIDLALLVFGAAVLIGAWRKGFIRPLCDVICLLLSLALTGYFVVRGTIAFQASFIVFCLIRLALAMVQARLLPRRQGILSLFDRILGVLLGLVRIYIVYALVFYALSFFSVGTIQPESSIVYPYFKEVETYVRQAIGV